MAVKDRKTGKVLARIVDNRTAKTLKGIVKEHMQEGATVFSDATKGYSGLSNENYDHQIVNHSVSEYVRGCAHVNGIKSFWSILKRSFYGTFHNVSPKHLHHYVNEFSTRHNMRELDTIDIMQWTVSLSIGKRLTYKELIANPKPS